ncbi:PIG-L deacetylase family protein [Ornithinicoccus hortensis]|uniref:GlcNAc-PI de-N-acetylase n=1 Tax=Ornithinicoccus hortensis TaxID=82346 RepID=A0A542YS35_9MICO|nr:PIG-L family deacetylase [Ornithinicoccus hortensis]TQL50744.1 GlcNAc-PI de-N-acetylase [Ornithinicoccus hortensis]
MSGAGVTGFFFAHQDDETLQGAAAVANQVQTGRSVHLVCLTDGSAAVVRTRELAEILGYTPTRQEFAEARWAEFDEAGSRLGVPRPRRHTTGIPDKEVTVAAAREVMEAFLGEHPGADLVAHSFLDAHPDHRNIGKALDDLRAEEGVSARFCFSRRYDGVVPTPRRWLERAEALDPAVVAERYVTLDLDRRWWSVGALSSGGYFDSWLADPYAIVHLGSDAFGSAEERAAAFDWVEKQGGYR